ncbi:MAG: hypothetical protein QXW56_03300 [Nitrososphaerota archaeon]
MDRELLLLRVDRGALRGLRCMACGAPLDGSRVLGYPHSGGTVVLGGTRLWAFIECRRCRYQNSLVGLGVDGGGVRVLGAERLGR